MNARASSALRIDIPQVRVQTLARLIVYQCRGAVHPHRTESYWGFDSHLKSFYWKTKRTPLTRERAAKLTVYMIYLWPEEKFQQFNTYPFFAAVSCHLAHEQDQIIELIGAHLDHGY